MKTIEITHCADTNLVVRRVEDNGKIYYDGYRRVLSCAPTTEGMLSYLEKYNKEQDLSSSSLVSFFEDGSVDVTHLSTVDNTKLMLSLMDDYKKLTAWVFLNGGNVKDIVNENNDK